MDALYPILIDYGPWGMFVSALLSGTVLPFSSEAVLVGLLAVGVNPWTLLLAASAGNVLGGVTCYYVGRCTTPERIQKIFGIKPKNMERARRLVRKICVNKHAPVCFTRKLSSNLFGKGRKVSLGVEHLVNVNKNIVGVVFAFPCIMPFLRSSIL